MASAVCVQLWALARTCVLTAIAPLRITARAPPSPPQPPSVRQAIITIPQVAGALAIFSSVRACVEEARGGGGLLASAIGGGAAVAAANTLLPSRRLWHLKYYTAVLGRPAGVGFVAAASALSGAVVLGGSDAALRAALGVQLG